ncbi:hypothetical protein KKG24_01760 [Patescibacteria group bacterium]|nr:hypothetical protein [Patescibacteria group bacterium]
MQKQAKKVLILTAGIIFIILGILGLFLPILQGIIFLAIGFFLVSFYFPGIRPWVNEHLKKYPGLFARIEKIEAWMKKIIGEI